jgi:phage-related protein
MGKVAAHEHAARDITHLRNDIWEVRVSGRGVIYRLLYARHKERRLLLGLAILNKKTQKTPQKDVNLAERRWADWKKRHDLK